ncbi:hypothetical protein HZA99_01960 [Candidatus Woesearchaeota archaeon]|nr:hypothetical protein [Candidatus Woesearchaeota archaeon]
MKKLLVLFLLFAVLLTLFGCANKQAVDELSSEPSSGTASANATTESYDPVLVDNITSDLDQMTW